MKKKRWMAAAAAVSLLLTGCGGKNGVTSNLDLSSDSTGDYAAGSLMGGGTIDGSPAEAGSATDGAWTEVTSEMSETLETDQEQFIQPVAGLLTAGEWNDNENWEFFANLVTSGRFSFQRFGISPYHRVVVHAVSAGTAVKNAKVKLMDSQGVVIAEAVTNYAGTAYLYYQVEEQESAEEPHQVVVTVNGVDTTADLSGVEAMVVMPVEQGQQPEQQPIEEPVEEPVEELAEEPVYDTDEVEEPAEESLDAIDTEEAYAGSEEYYVNSQEIEIIQPMPVIQSEVTVEIAAYTPAAKKLDVMFVFDTTGSMGDELAYLQKEFEDIAQRVADQSTRFSVNFYRDLEDAYVVRSNEFTSDIEAAARLINEETADGGGDYEEAVDLALQDAVFSHSWDADSVKLLFLILDAPPHDTEETRQTLQQAIDAAAAMGIRIIPIASSGVNTMTEGFLRTAAMLTGGTYTFLTNHSGIGGLHLEPTIGDYTVESLNDLIVRLIEQYYQ